MTHDSTGSPEPSLLARAIRGDIEAFGGLYDLYLGPIYIFIFYQVTNVHEAEDLTEQVFLKAFEKLPEFRTAKRMDNFRAWLYRIARNLVIDHYRTNRRPASLEEAAPLEGEGASPEEQVQLNEAIVRLRDALQQLDPRARQVIVMRFMNGLSYPETARAIGLTENHVRVIQFRALQKIRSLIDPEGAGI